MPSFRDTAKCFVIIVLKAVIAQVMRSILCDGLSSGQPGKSCGRVLECSHVPCVYACVYVGLAHSISCCMAPK